MNLEEKTVKSEEVFKGRIVELKVDTVLLPDGRYSTREIVKHDEAVAIVAIDERRNIYLVQQYRKPIEKVLLEIPAGIMNKGEKPLAAAKRELEEETGFKAERWENLGFFYTAPGFTDEKIHLFLARELIEGKVNLDEDEFVKVEVMPFKKAYDMALNGGIIDAKTIIGIQLAKVKLGWRD
ncbi:NUDIX hydrolase [Thermosyntropha sp.]|uniref:NUDIX domain-containing protein n=1 Tax=Thermosyntropha sp. TaxID=2740820 RepID=UPI0025E65A04|nr:NUDIX hydrolase [Thermosyntropha sp.]MBO8159174.1 NUDIX hydrolase [Thermosyntropha sp.]